MIRPVHLSQSSPLSFASANFFARSYTVLTEQHTTLQGINEVRSSSMLTDLWRLLKVRQALTGTLVSARSRFRAEGLYWQSIRSGGLQ